jgi:hypothetical protein
MANGGALILAELVPPAGLPLDRPVDVLRRLSLAQSYEVWEALLDRTRNPALPMPPCRSRSR